MEGKHFFEPTQELDFIRNLTEGRFNVLLLPTQVADIQRWQIFAHNSQTGRIDSFNIERSGDGLFNTRGTQFYTSPSPQYQSAVFERQPGTCPFTDQPLIPIISKEGRAESALEFGGIASDYVKIENFAGFPSTAITVEFWARSDHPSGGNTTISYASSDDVAHAFELYRFRNLIVQINNANRGEMDVSFNDGQWHHVAVSWESSNGLIKIYKDGDEEYSELLAKGATIADGGCLVFGQQQDSLGGGFGSWQGFKGQMKEVRIWNHARSTYEISGDMNYRLVGDEPGLVGYWQFDEGAGNILRDQTDKANDGTIHGTAWVTSDAPIGDRPGIRLRSSDSAEKALSFDGQDNYVQLPEMNIDLSQGFTVEAWVY